MTKTAIRSPQVVRRFILQLSMREVGVANVVNGDHWLARRSLPVHHVPCVAQQPACMGLPDDLLVDVLFPQSMAVFGHQGDERRPVLGEPPSPTAVEIPFVPAPLGTVQSLRHLSILSEKSLGMVFAVRTTLYIMSRLRANSACYECTNLVPIFSAQQA